MLATPRAALFPIPLATVCAEESSTVRNSSAKAVIAGTTARVKKIIPVSVILFHIIPFSPVHSGRYRSPEAVRVSAPIPATHMADQSWDRNNQVEEQGRKQSP